MRILHVITGMQKAAGTSVFCGEVCNGLVTIGHEVSIAVPKPNISDCYPIDSRIKLIPISSLLNNFNRPNRLGYNIIHIHALWSPLLHKVAKWTRQSGVPIVWSPHGMLTPWAMNNKKWKKWIAWWLYQKRDLKRANIIHATAQSEVEDVRRMGLKNRVLVAPLGVKVDCRIERVSRVDGKKVLLFVSRVQRKKGLENLVRAWALLPNELKREWAVRVVGPDEDGHTAELKVLCLDLCVEDAFEFVGPKYGDDLAREYASADLFVLPTHSENFGSVVIEALAHGIPVICTKGAPWEELGTHKCGWWIDIGVEPLAITLKEAMSLTAKLRQKMGACGRKLVEEKYAWDVVSETIMNAYLQLIK